MIQKLMAFLGLHNRARSRKQHRGEGQLISLATAQNIDIDDEGAVSSRDGYALSLSLTDAQNGFNVMRFSYGLVVDNGTLKRVSPDGDVTSLGSVENIYTEFLEVGNKIFLSTGHIVDDGVLIPWAVYPPEPPTVTVIGGFLIAGVYQVLITKISDDGRESASCAPVLVELADGSGLRLAGVEGCMVYVTDANGAVYNEVGYQVYEITSLPEARKPINPELIVKQTFPRDITKIAFDDERMWCAYYDHVNDRSALFYSAKHLFHVFDYFSGVVDGIDGIIRLLHGTPQGLLIGTDRAIMLYSEAGLSYLADYGVPSGKPLSVTRSGQVFFMSLRGVCTMPFQNLTGDKFTCALGGECVSAIVENSGNERFVLITDGTGAAEDSTDF